MGEGLGEAFTFDLFIIELPWLIIACGDADGWGVPMESASAAALAAAASPNVSERMRILKIVPPREGAITS